MILREVFEKLENIAPVSLSERFCKKYSMYDNSGILINFGERTNISGALFSLDLSLKAVEAAKSKGFNLIITHHPAIYGGISKIDLSNPLSAAIVECVKCGISVISMHLNFDAAPEGLDYWLMRGVGGVNAKILAEIEGGGYGRYYAVKRQNFSAFVSGIKKVFSTQRLTAYGTDKPVSSVVSFCGAGCDDAAIAFAVENKADALISSDLKHHQIAEIVARGVNVVQLTHYSSENYGFKQIYSNLELGCPSHYFVDEGLL